MHAVTISENVNVTVYIRSSQVLPLAGGRNQDPMGHRILKQKSRLHPTYMFLSKRLPARNIPDQRSHYALQSSVLLSQRFQVVLICSLLRGVVLFRDALPAGRRGVPL
jgi:hypothetical protein